MPSSPSKGSKGSKASPEALEALEKAIFGRERYDDMDSVFFRRSKNMILYAHKIHLYEVWNQLPPLQPQAADEAGRSASPKGSKGSKKSNSPKSKSPGKSKSGSPVPAGDEPPKAELEKAILMGAVAVPKELSLDPAEKIFVEVAADFTYYDYSKVPPFPPAVVSKLRLFRDFCHIFPLDFDRPVPYTVFEQDMIKKVHQELPAGWHCYAFQFDLTRLPDSLFFSRPYHVENITGLSWTLRAFSAKLDYCQPLPENEVSMTFYKYTIAPVVTPSAERPICSMEYNRFACLEDQGDLVITAQLDRDVYYHGDTVNVTVNISNDSARHVVSAITVCIEQNCKLVNEIPHTFTVRIGEIYIGSGEFGLPVNPKNKGWSKEFNIRPMYDRSLYNLVVDGRMSRDNKIFLAESTVIMRADKVKIEPPPEEPAGRKSPKSGSKGSKDTSNKKASKDSSKKGSPKEAKGSPQPTAPPEEPEPVQPLEKEVNVLVGSQVCRNAIISYEAVVRCTIRTMTGEEGGAPSLRVPFILSRNSRYIDKLNVQTPPVFAIASMH
nr:unnamed protein product [Spirometra erinaceieuropaei]